MGYTDLRYNLIIKPVDYSQTINDIENFISKGEKLFGNVKTSLEKHWKDFKEILNEKNIARKECLLLPLKTISKALKS